MIAGTAYTNYHDDHNDTWSPSTLNDYSYEYYDDDILDEDFLDYIRSRSVIRLNSYLMNFCRNNAILSATIRNHYRRKLFARRVHRMVGRRRK